MIGQLLRRRPMSEAATNQAINDFQSETAEITGAPYPVAARGVLYLLAGMITLAIIVASVMKIERVVTANGRIVSESPTLMVQPLETSIIRAIKVREGQVVHKGDVLATLDPTFSTADVGNLQAQAARLQAEIERLTAEEKGQPYHPAVEDPYNALQLSIWRSRQAEYEAKILGYRQKIESDQATIARAQQDVAHFRSRLGLASQVEGMRKELERSQVGSRLNSLLASDARVEISRNLSEAENTITAASHEMESQRAERDVFMQQWKSNIAKDLVDRRADYDKVHEELTKARKRQDLVDLRAVEDAIVLEVGHVSVGSVMQPGEKLMTLVPMGSHLFVEADIDARDQGFVAPGQAVALKFAAYDYIDHGTGHGTVRTISADSFAPRETNVELGNRFYRARIDVDDLPLRHVPKDFRLIPGMTLDADIVVGKRTIMAYILEGALKNFSEGMREP